VSRKRIHVAEPDPDVRALLELTLERLGHETVAATDDDVDAVVMEPGCPLARTLLARFARLRTPIVCVSIYPPEAGLAPPGTIAYLMKPLRMSRLDSALAGAFAA
jgi:hypothetical protein